CEVDYKKRLTHVYRCICFDTPKNAIEDGYIRDMEAIAGILKDKLREAGIRDHKLVFTIASTKIANREVIIPLVKKNRIQDIVNVNAEEYFPIDISKFIITYNIYERITVGEDKSLRLFVLAAPENMVKDYYDIAKRLGCEIVAIDYIGNSAYQVVAKNSGNDISLIVQVSEQMTFLGILEKGVLSLPRTLPFGYMMIKDNGNNKDNNLQYLISDITRILEYYTRKENKKINTIYFNGQIFRLPGFQKMLQQQIDIKVKSIELRNNIKFHNELNLKEEEKEEFFCCIGAAIKPVDFIPKEFLESHRKSGNIHNFLFALSASIAFGAILVCSSYLSYRSEKMINISLDKEIVRLSEINHIYEEHTSEMERYKEASSLNTLTVNPNDKLNYLLDELEDKLPAETVVESFSVNTSGITVSLKTSSEITAAVTLQQLKKIPILSQINAGAVALSEDENKVKTVKFVVTGTYITEEQAYEDE
ncbi:MAG TPA: pilus assembly protein PilM, partial [Mobilitalea sp.]|nr:pilus assembly protein PilM [Mobilitalea sp.]